MNDYITSPCSKKCTLNEQNICTGCFRSKREILDWLRMNQAQQLATLERCRERQQQVLTFRQKLRHYVSRLLN
jgi:hypothetical protein